MIHDACVEDERVALLAAGFTEVIPKPCNPDDLVDAVERLLDGNQPISA